MVISTAMPATSMKRQHAAAEQGHLSQAIVPMLQAWPAQPFPRAVWFPRAVVQPLLDRLRTGTIHAKVTAMNNLLSRQLGCARSLQEAHSNNWLS
jgi:hypothetical protein